jgi:hypothetical protein
MVVPGQDTASRPAEPGGKSVLQSPTTELGGTALEIEWRIALAGDNSSAVVAVVVVVVVVVGAGAGAAAAVDVVAVD